ncbi:MAG: glycosyltransferase family 9 protein [Planctomycetota bacterium]
MTRAADVVVVRMSAMGDVVHSLGAIEALARARPGWRVHVAVQEEIAPLLCGLDHIASVVTHRRRPAVVGMLRSRRLLRRLRCDLALDLQGNWKSALAVRLSGARRRVGIAPPWRREPGSARLLTELVPATQEAAHPRRLALDVVRHVAPDAPDLLPRLVSTEAELAREAAALQALGIDAELPFLVLVLGPPRDNRSWPAGSAALEAAACPWPALVLLGPAEPSGMQVPPGVPLLRHGVGELRRLVALGGLVARAGGRVVGPDQGPTHVLAATGAEVTALYGAQDPDCTASSAVRVLVRRDRPSCVPCRRRVCDHAEGPVCMQFQVATGEPPSPPLA